MHAAQPYLIWIGAWAIVANTASKTSSSFFSLYSPLYVANEGHKRDADNDESDHRKQSVCPIIVLTAWRIIIVSRSGEHRANWWCMIARQDLKQFPHSNANTARHYVKEKRNFIFRVTLFLSPHFCEPAEKNEPLSIYGQGNGSRITPLCKYTVSSMQN